MTKWKIKRLEDVCGKLNFQWEKADNDKGAKWDFEKMEAEIKKMDINEEKIIDV